MSRVDLERLRNLDAVAANLRGLVLAELKDAREALELVKQDGHDHPEEGGCLSCEAIAEYERKWGKEAKP